MQDLQRTAAYVRAAIAEASQEEAFCSLLLRLMALPGRILHPQGPAKFPLFVIQFSTAFGGNAEAAIRAAAAVEFAIVTTDIIDDLADNEWNENLGSWPRALNATLALNSLAQRCILELASHIGSARAALISQLLNRNIFAACVGEDLDLQFEETTAVTEEQAYRMTELKAGSLVRMACQIGVAVVTDEPSVLEAAGRFGTHVGVIAQLQNDLAGVNTNVLLRGTDLRRKKKTLPIAYALQCAREDNASALLNLYHPQSSLTSQEEERLAHTIRDLGGLHFTWIIASSHRREALAELRLLYKLSGRTQVRQLRHLVPLVRAQRAERGPTCEKDD